MKKILLEASFSKIYMIAMILISLLILGGYFSYAMFTVSKEKSNAISIVTGNLTYELLVDGEEMNILSVPANSSKEFIVTLTNPNNRVARFNFYYKGELPAGVVAGYIIEDGFNTLPPSEGLNLEKSGTTGSSNVYKIRVSNNSNSVITINLGVGVGLDYNDLSIEEDEYLFDEADLSVSGVLLSTISKDNKFDDGEDTFITGDDPNNYIWYSGKLWRAVSINNKEKTTKLVTEWVISSVAYNYSGNSNFDGSYMESWLNDTTVDGFLGNLREPEKFIKMDSKWNATMTTSSSKPSSTTIVEAPVGLLNVYEYVTSYTGTTASNGYLNNGLTWRCLTPYSSTNNYYITYSGSVSNDNTAASYGIRPSVNLNSYIKIVDGNGTVSDPYRLDGDNDTDLNGTFLNTRYSGEYITFGTGENDLYRIVSHETEGLTKVTSAEPLKKNGNFVTSVFGSNSNFLNPNQIVVFLNTTYLTVANGYLTAEQVNMIQNRTDWYMGTVGNGVDYRLAKYTDSSMSSTTTSAYAKVGLLRFGELMTGQYTRYGIKGTENATNTTIRYWLINPYDSRRASNTHQNATGSASYSTSAYGVKPTFNLKNNIIITGGTGVKEDPFIIELSS